MLYVFQKLAHWGYFNCEIFDITLVEPCSLEKSVNFVTLVGVDMFMIMLIFLRSTNSPS
jgi:hypothetical protein